MSPLKKSILLAFTLLLLSPVMAQAQEMRFIRDEEIEQTLRIMSTPVFDQAGLSAANVRFVLVDSNELNAFVAGGQNIFLNTGLILTTKTPDELLGVIAHETGHISAGHLFRARAEIENASLQSMLANVIGVAAAIGTRTPGVGMAIGSAGQTVALRGMLRHTRIQESAADQAGVRFLTGAGLPLSGFASFMEQLGAQELLPESQQNEYVRTHPLTSDRIDFLKEMEKTAKPGAIPPLWVMLHDRMKAKLLGYLFPDRALQDRGNSIESRYGRAIAYYRKNEIQKSLDLLNPLIAQEPDNPYFHELKGQMLFEAGRIEEAVAAYRKAVTHAPRSALIRTALGHALLELPAPDINSAIDAFTRSLQLEPRRADTHRFLAIAYGKKGNNGMFRLHMAEEALLQNRLDAARKEAGLAKAALPKGSPAILRAEDILAAASIADKNSKKNKKGD